jgi:hypothetical protein
LSISSRTFLKFQMKYVLIIFLLPSCDSTSKWEQFECEEKVNLRDHQRVLDRQADDWPSTTWFRHSRAIEIRSLNWISAVTRIREQNAMAWRWCEIKNIFSECKKAKYCYCEARRFNWMLKKVEPFSCLSMLKTLVCDSHTITWAFNNCYINQIFSRIDHKVKPVFFLFVPKKN